MDYTSRNWGWRWNEMKEGDSTGQDNGAIPLQSAVLLFFKKRKE